MEIKVTSHLGDIMSASNAQILKGMIQCGMVAEGHAKIELTNSGAVDTGNLRNSINHTENEKIMKVSTSVEYAPFIELGTVKMRARPYLKPAIANHVDEYVTILQNALKG